MRKPTAADLRILAHPGPAEVARVLLATAPSKRRSSARIPAGASAQPREIRPGDRGGEALSERRPVSR